MAKYTFNKNFFDKIDSEEKAYWLGFCWCDGTVVKRNKKGSNHVEYCMKMDLAIVDKHHLEKLRDSLESNHDIKEYTYKSYFNGKDATIGRLAIYNVYFGSVLYHDYGMIPNRSDVSKLTNSIPKDLLKHFIRGVVDAEGSVNHYTCSEGQKKVAVGITTTAELNDFINEHLVDVGLLKSKLKQMTRHEERDETCKSLTISGRLQASKVLDYLYTDAQLYLDRKFSKATEAIDFAK